MKVLPSNAKLNDASFSRVHRHLSVDPDVQVSDLLRPGFWIHHGNQLGRFDLIDVVATDGSLDVQLRVDLIEKGLPWMRVLRAYVRDGRPTVDDDAPVADAPDGYLIDQNAKGGWRARTKHPVIVLADGLLTRDEAMRAALEHAAKAAGGEPEPKPDKPKRTASSPAPETADTRAAVEIPDDWQSLGWAERRSLASKLTDDPVRNGEEANAAIEAELARRSTK
jgi:hypothetical protein